MKALHFDGKKLQLVEKDIPETVNGDSLVKVLYAGICNTDLEVMNGYMDFRGTIGHEFVGVVEKTNSPGLLGKHVVGDIHVSCGECEFCAQGLGRHCPNRTVLGIQDKDGSLAEYLTLPTRNLHIVPSDVPDIAAVFAEPLAAAYEITQQLQILNDYRVLVVGDGKLGQLVARVLQFQTENLLVVGKHPEKLAILEELNIPTRLLSEFDAEEKSFHVVVDAAGSWEGWQLAMKMVRPRGFLVLKSTYSGEHKCNPANLVVNEITVIGSRGGSFSDSLHLLRKNIIDPSEIISAVLPVSEWKKAFKIARLPESLKVLIEF
ncbi:MAG: alcohol dehydrogenase catalytic domain-containing protein [Calditrichia bacterium]